MPALYRKGKPFEPPVIHGFSFFEVHGHPGIWYAPHVPDNKLDLFHVGKKGAVYFLTMEEIPGFLPNKKR
jgi:hypothetical protein